MKSVGELMLLKAYGIHVVRRERCLCGGLITADALDDGTWAPVVQRHQRTNRHMQWRVTAGWWP